MLRCLTASLAEKPTIQAEAKNLFSTPLIGLRKRANTEPTCPSTCELL